MMAAGRCSRTLRHSTLIFWNSLKGILSHILASWQGNLVGRVGPRLDPSCPWGDPLKQNSEPQLPGTQSGETASSTVHFARATCYAASRLPGNKFSGHLALRTHSNSSHSGSGLTPQHTGPLSRGDHKSQKVHGRPLTGKTWASHCFPKTAQWRFILASPPIWVPCLAPCLSSSVWGESHDGGSFWTGANGVRLWVSYPGLV
jgi:hypothetical protein